MDTTTALLQTLLTIIVVFGLLVGLIITPFAPGLVVIWLSVLAWALYDGFTWASVILFAIITLLMIAGNLIDNFMMGKEARGQGASWWALAVGVVVLLVASIFLTPVVGLLLAVLAVFLVEFARLKDWKRALASVKGIAMGWGKAAVIRLVIAFVMVGLWVAWYMFL